MSSPTLKQSRHIQQLILDSWVDAEGLQRIISSGFLSDLLIADVTKVDRGDFRRVLKIQAGLIELNVTNRKVDELEILKGSHFNFVHPNILDHVRQNNRRHTVCERYGMFLNDAFIVEPWPALKRLQDHKLKPINLSQLIVLSLFLNQLPSEKHLVCLGQCISGGYPTIFNYPGHCRLGLLAPGNGFDKNMLIVGHY